jgi:hypothetical protein
VSIKVWCSFTARSVAAGNNSVEKHFQERSAELQIPPLRYAPVGMTKGRVALPFRFDTADDEQQVPPLRYGRDDNSVRNGEKNE